MGICVKSVSTKMKSETPDFANRKATILLNLLDFVKSVETFLLLLAGTEMDMKQQNAFHLSITE